MLGFLGVATTTKDPRLQASHWLVTECGSQVGDRSYGPRDDDLSRDCSYVNSSIGRGPAHVVGKKEVKFRVPGTAGPRDVQCSWWRSNRSGVPKGAWLTERPREGLLPISPHNTRKRTIWVGVQATDRTFCL